MPVIIFSPSYLKILSLADHIFTHLLEEITLAISFFLSYITNFALSMGSFSSALIHAIILPSLKWKLSLDPISPICSSLGQNFLKQLSLLWLQFLWFYFLLSPLHSGLCPPPLYQYYTHQFHQWPSHWQIQWPILRPHLIWPISNIYYIRSLFSFLLLLAFQGLFNFLLTVFHQFSLTVQAYRWLFIGGEHNDSNFGSLIPFCLSLLSWWSHQIWWL